MTFEYPFPSSADLNGWRSGADTELLPAHLPDPSWPHPEGPLDEETCVGSPFSSTARDFLRVAGPGVLVGCAYRWGFHIPYFIFHTVSSSYSTQFHFLSPYFVIHYICLPLSVSHGPPLICRERRDTKGAVTGSVVFNEEDCVYFVIVRKTRRSDYVRQLVEEDSGSEDDDEGPNKA